MQRGLSSSSPSRRRPGRHILLSNSLFSTSPLSLSPLTNPYLPGRIPRRRQEQGSSHRELPHEVIRHAHGPRAGILVPIPSAPAGRAATRIRRPRAIDSISRPPVFVSPWRRRSEDPPAPWDRVLLLFVGAQLDSGAVHA